MLWSVLLVLFPGLAAADETIEAEARVKDVDPALVGDMDQTGHTHLHFEQAWVEFGSREVLWRSVTARFAALDRGVHRAYLDLGRIERDGEPDYTLDYGMYRRFASGYAHGELGIGFDVDYVHNFQCRAELAHRISGHWVGKAGVRAFFRETRDVLIVSPGLTHYFGNHYWRVECGVSLTEGRGEAYWAAGRLNLLLRPYLAWWAGGAAGDRLYDVDPTVDDRPYGYVLYTGFDFNLDGGIFLGTGYSYAWEDPDFKKQGLDFRLTVKF
jgi:YaiO family outer membrane protein